MRPPHIGAVVVFTTGFSTPLGTQPEYLVVAAIVTAVHADDSVDLHMFIEEQTAFKPAVHFSSAPPGSEYAIGRWSWPNPRLRNERPGSSQDWMAGLPDDTQEARHGL